MLPSVRMESFGIVLLEGMAAGCVAVASALPGPAEVVGDAGLDFPPGDVDALARILRSLSSENARQPLVERSLERSRGVPLAAHDRQLFGSIRGGSASRGRPSSEFEAGTGVGSIRT